jgi:hypothetical protein
MPRTSQHRLPDCQSAAVGGAERTIRPGPSMGEICRQSVSQSRGADFEYCNLDWAWHGPRALHPGRIALWSATSLVSPTSAAPRETVLRQYQGDSRSQGSSTFAQQPLAEKPARRGSAPRGVVLPKKNFDQQPGHVAQREPVSPEQCECRQEA